MYATATELRERFRRDDDDEFATLEDAALVQALTAASAEINSWLPSGTLSTAATGVVRDKALILARMFAHQDQALSQDHPVVRDALEVRTWLKAVASGRVLLPTDSVEAARASSAPVATVRELIYTPELWEHYTQ